MAHAILHSWHGLNYFVNLQPDRIVWPPECYILFNLVVIAVMVCDTPDPYILGVWFYCKFTLEQVTRLISPVFANWLATNRHSTLGIREDIFDFARIAPCRDHDIVA